MNTTDNQEEIFIVVNTNDEIVGYKTRWECHHDKNLIHRVVGVILTNSEGKILLQKRSMTKDMDAGIWGISAAGHVQKGQSYEQAIENEIKEELGITVPVNVLHTFLFQGEHETEMAKLFEGVHNGPFTINPEETQETRFFSKTEIEDLVKKHTLPLAECTKNNLRFIGVHI
jgi:isopentenyl-diphosphate delta-isomerase type 1